jgi:hypothetical protein
MLGCTASPPPQLVSWVDDYTVEFPHFFKKVEAGQNPDNELEALLNPAGHRLSRFYSRANGLRIIPSCSRRLEI